MQKLKYLVLVCFLAMACKTETPLTAQDIIDKTLEVSGGDTYLNAEIDFDFRDIHYRSKRDHGKFHYERVIKDSVGTIKDVLNNDGFQRFVNNELAEIPDSMAVKYTSSVNSVHYFALLPFGLNDVAVNKSSLGEVSVNDKLYYKIKVWFSQEGGGEDFEDVFIYWISKDTFKADYIAYSYIEDDGVGIRFREAYNERMVNGLRFVDYNNYKSEEVTMDLLGLDKAYESGSLLLLSKIELENIEVK
ncbi:MAG: deoxyribose-phosphate aldolase [Bacteroidetes bacterium]|nr:MAG: deoxyribose-phosphate aldolase [Bacteroidota bacterium]